MAAWHEPGRTHDARNTFIVLALLLVAGVGVWAAASWIMLDVIGRLGL